MHYFIEYTNLPIQDIVDTYGTDSNNPINVFNITSRFQLTEIARAFACQDSMMIVQQSVADESLVNIILKPVEGLKIPFNSIQYYVYRGIAKNSLFIGNSLKSDTSTDNSELLKRVWEDYNDYKAKHTTETVEQLKPQDFGYDNTLIDSLNIENLYDNSQTDIRPIYVKEGEWIGNFAFKDFNGKPMKIGFEIILDTEKINVDLKYVRSEKQSVDVSGLTGLELRAKREQILSFIDPAAFFGLHYDVGISASIFNGSKKTTVKKKNTELYSHLLEKFATKNRVYLDIRSEYGYSYNFYQNYDDGTGNNIKIGNSVVTPVAQNYSINDWPIIGIETAIETTEHYNNLQLQLRIDDNTKPLLFFQNTALLGSKNHSRFIDDARILNETANDWSKVLTFYFPNTGTEQNKNNVAYYIKLHYFRQEYNPASPNTVLKNETYYDSAFCPINLTNIANSNYHFQTVRNPDLNYIKGIFPNGTTEFGYIAENGVVWDSNKIVFYSQIIFQNKNSVNLIPPVPTFATNSGIDLTGSYPKMSLINKEISVLKNEIDENTFGNVDVLEFVHYSGLFPFKENVMLLCITQSEFQTIKDLTGLSDQHNRYIFIKELPNSPFSDSSGIEFGKYEVKLQGLDNNGIQTVVSPPTSIYVYSKDGFTFNSRDFGSIENIDNKAKISKIYGNVYVFEWSGYINDSREANVVQLLENTCLAIPSITPALLFTIAIGEGLNLWIDDNYDSVSPYNVMINNRINGFDYLGTDDFGGDFSRYQPYLPTSYNEGDEFDKYYWSNEWGDSIISADFKNLKSGLLGIGATIAHRKDKFLLDASKLGFLLPNIDQIVFWTYVYFQGEGRAKGYLILNKGFDFTKKAPVVQIGTDKYPMADVRKKALERLATWRYIKTKNILSK